MRFSRSKNYAMGALLAFQEVRIWRQKALSRAGETPRSPRVDGRATAPPELPAVGTDVAPFGSHCFAMRNSFRNGAAMAKTVSDFLVQRLLSWGVRRVYGYPGDGINGVMGALNRAGGSIDFV